MFSFGYKCVPDVHILSFPKRWWRESTRSSADVAVAILSFAPSPKNRSANSNFERSGLRPAPGRIEIIPNSLAAPGPGSRGCGPRATVGFCGCALIDRGGMLDRHIAVLEGQFVVDHVNRDLAALGQLAE